MAELTIHLSEEAHNALLAAADSRGRSVDELVEETLEKAGLFSSRRVTGWPRKARTGSPRSKNTGIEDRRLLDRLNEVYADGPTPEERDFQKRMCVFNATLTTDPNRRNNFRRCRPPVTLTRMRLETKAQK